MSKRYIVMCHLYIDMKKLCDKCRNSEKYGTVEICDVCNELVAPNVIRFTSESWRPIINKNKAV